MNENEIKNRIQIEADDYVIKTKSSTILNRFLETKDQKRPFFTTNIFKFSTLGISCAALIITTSIVLTNKINKNNEIPLNNKVLNMTAIEALAGISYLNNENIDNNRYAKRLSSISYKEDDDFTDNQFKQICDIFYTYVPMITNLSLSFKYIFVTSGTTVTPYCFILNIPKHLVSEI